MKTFLCSLALATLLCGGCAHLDPTPELKEKPWLKPEDRKFNTEDKPDPFIVRSPFGKHRKMDLTGMEPGTKVQDPTTGGIFKVPATVDEEPEIVSEPPADWTPEKTPEKEN